MRIIKKYTNRRLYDTSSSSYVNLESLAELIRSGEMVKIIDAQSGGDLTRLILMQIILETQGALELMPVGLLHRMIRLGAHNPMHAMFRQQLAVGLDMIDAQISRMEAQFHTLYPNATPPPAATPSSPPAPDAPPAKPPPPEPSEAGEDLDAFRARLAALEARLGQ